MVQTRATGPPEKTLEKKREILAAASRVFRKKGLHATGMRDVAAGLGMAVGNLYYYFEDKEDLLAFVQESTLDDLHRLAAGVRGLDLPAEQKLFLLAAGQVVLLNEGTPGSLAHLEVEALGDQRRWPIQARRDEYEQCLRGLVDEGISTGAFRAVDPKVAALALLGAVNWTVKWFRLGGAKSARTIGWETAEMLVRGLLVPGTAFAPPDTALLEDLLPSDVAEPSEAVEMAES
jgi:TetR/AcrR family transcriptional regulator, cholesterol catabolism regulator